MNNIKIAYDGRVTAWNSDLKTPKASKLPTSSESLEWELFLTLPPEGKAEFLGSGLGSSHVTNSDATAEPVSRARRGAKGVTAHGRGLIRCGAQYLEDKFGLSCLSFLTCTLPESALIACTPETWAECVNRMLKSLRYHLSAGGLCPQIVGCIEVQGSRLLTTQGLPPLHLHVVFQGRKRGKPWVLPSKFFLETWERVCRSVWVDSQGYQSSTRVESLRSSCAAYMGKYMSKGSDVLALSKPELLPSSWYTISTKLKDLVKSFTLKLSGSAAHDLYEYLYNGGDMLWCRSVMSEYTETGTCYLLAWVGQLRTRGIYWDIIDDVRPVLYALAEENLTGML